MPGLLRRAGRRSPVGTPKGVGRIRRRTFIDACGTVAFAELHGRKTPITAAGLLNNRVVPLFDERGIKLGRVAEARGVCG